MHAPSDLFVTEWEARLLGRRMPCATGRGGIRRDKREGDGATPAGVHRITGAFYRPDRIPAWQVPAGIPVRPFQGWSDDSGDPQYNKLIRQRLDHAFSHERLFRSDPLYDIVLLTDYNRADPVPELGSAIFLHTWRSPRSPTAGCIAFDRSDLVWIAQHLTIETHLIVKGRT